MRKKEEETRFCYSTPFPLWPAPHKSCSSHSRVGLTFQEVPKKLKGTFGKCLVDSIAKNNIEREQKDTVSQIQEGPLPVVTPGTCLGQPMCPLCPLHTPTPRASAHNPYCSEPVPP